MIKVGLSLNFVIKPLPMSYLPEKSTLFVIATPIGNMADLSARAIATLKDCQTIYAEDTRTAQSLLQKLGLSGQRLESYHDHSDDERRQTIVRILSEKPQRAALISEAGTPCISDPGYKLIRDLRRADIQVVAIPGASALLTLAAASGLPTNRLVFIGFLPHKDAAVRGEFASWERYVGHSLVFFDSLRRLERDLNILVEFYPDAEVAVGRELTKMHEETLTAPIAEVLAWLSAKETLKGEVSVMVNIPASARKQDSESQVNALRAEAEQRFRDGARLKELLREFKDRGLNRGDLYTLLLAAKKDGSRE